MEDDEAARSTDYSGTGRLLAFSDGVFAIAFTILVLDLDVPAGLDPEMLRAALAEQWPHVLSALLSFAVIGRFWIAHHGLLARVRQADSMLLGLNTVLLAGIALVPFGASLLAEYGRQPIAVIIYSGIVALVALVQLAVWLWAARRGFLDPAVAEPDRLRMTFGLAGAALAFVVAIPVALVSTTAAQLCWLIAVVPSEPFPRWWGARRG